MKSFEKDDAQKLQILTEEIWGNFDDGGPFNMNKVVRGLKSRGLKQLKSNIQ